MTLEKIISIDKVLLEVRILLPPHRRGRDVVVWPVVGWRVLEGWRGSRSSRVLVVTPS